MSTNQVQAILREQGRSQRWLARRIGCSEEHLSRVLHGHVPASERLIVACSRVLELPPTVLFPHAQLVPDGTDIVPDDASVAVEPEPCRVA